MTTKEPAQMPGGFLPRLWVQLLSAPFSKTPEAIHVRVTTQCRTNSMPGDWEYLSLSEHSQLLSAAKREARAQAFEEATHAAMRLSQAKLVQMLIEKRREASEQAREALRDLQGEKQGGT